MGIVAARRQEMSRIPQEEVRWERKRVGKPAKKPVSSKAQADPAAEKKYRGEGRADRTRKRQIEQRASGSRRGPQGAEWIRISSANINAFQRVARGSPARN